MEPSLYIGQVKVRSSKEFPLFLYWRKILVQREVYSLFPVFGYFHLLRILPLYVFEKPSDNFRFRSIVIERKLLGYEFYRKYSVFPSLLQVYANLANENKSYSKFYEEKLLSEWYPIRNSPMIRNEVNGQLNWLCLPNRYISEKEVFILYILIYFIQWIKKLK